MDESNVLIKQMPMSVEAEQAVLGAIIIKPESFDQIAGLITANDFYLEDCELYMRNSYHTDSPT